MHYHIYCNQKNINDNHALAIKEFQKRLSAYCETTLHVTQSLYFPKDINRNNHQFIYLRPGISTHSSEEFANFINTQLHSGKSIFHIVIGFDEALFYKTISFLPDYDMPLCISLTHFNLSNETKTLLFYEQLYRGYTILQGKTYHK